MNSRWDYFNEAELLTIEAAIKALVDVFKVPGNMLSHTVSLRKNTLDKVGKCKVCGCTDTNCLECIREKGYACFWISKREDLCSRCAEKTAKWLLEDLKGQGKV